MKTKHFIYTFPNIKKNQREYKFLEWAGLGCD